MARFTAAVAIGAVLCLAMACGRAVVPPSANASSAASGPIASDLPAGVCAPTYERFNDPGATRIEAKLVTAETLSNSDPDWKNGFHIPSAYYWVVTESGVFYLGNYPRPEPPSGSPIPFRIEITYLKANPDPSDVKDRVQPCRAIEFQATNGAWPTWFDRMTAVDEVKVR